MELFQKVVPVIWQQNPEILKMGFEQMNQAMVGPQVMAMKAALGCFDQGNFSPAAFNPHFLNGWKMLMAFSILEYIRGLRQAPRNQMLVPELYHFWILKIAGEANISADHFMDLCNDCIETWKASAAQAIA